MVAGVRDKLTGYGWHRKQIVFEAVRLEQFESAKD